MSDLARLTIWDDHGDRCQNVFERHCLHQAAARRANVLVTEIVAPRAVLRVKRGAALLRYRGNRHRFGQRSKWAGAIVDAEADRLMLVVEHKKRSTTNPL